MSNELRLTNSRSKAWQRCPTNEGWSYREGFRPRKVSAPLHFGSAFHVLRERLWKGDREPRFTAAELADLDDFDVVKLYALTDGYVERWGHPRDTHDVVGVETFLETPLFHPDTNEDHPTEILAGKLDSMTRVEPGKIDVEIWDGKTTSESLDEGSPLWQRMVMDSQPSQYFVLAMAAGWEPVAWVHDVTRKPTMQPHKATPEDKRKFKKDGTLYASQRLHDESLEEYDARLREDIAERPEWYYARRRVVRFDHTLADHLRSLWGIAEMMQREPVKFTSGCVVTGLGACPFLDVCSSGGHPSDYPTVFEKIDDPHPELERNS